MLVREMTVRACSLNRIAQTSGPSKTTGLIDSGKKRRSRRQRGNRVGKPIRAVAGQFCTRYAAVSTDLSFALLATTAGLAFISSTFIQLTRMVIYRRASARRRSFKKLV
jgi:hypothetical protein